MEIKQVPAHPNNYSKSEHPKVGVVVHWIVGTQESADTSFSDANRKASTHYSISDTGVIHQYLDEKYMAYHAGKLHYNRHYLSIEHEGGYLVNGQRIKPSTACHDASAALIADMSKRHGFEINRETVIGHRETGYATQCPGTLDIEYIINKANFIKNQGIQPQEDIQTSAKKWNEKIKEKGYLVEGGAKSALINKLTPEKTELLVSLYRVVRTIQTNPTLVNSPEVGIILDRFVELTSKSSFI